MAAGAPGAQLPARGISSPCLHGSGPCPKHPSRRWVQKMTPPNPPLLQTCSLPPKTPLRLLVTLKKKCSLATKPAFCKSKSHLAFPVQDLPKLLVQSWVSADKQPLITSPSPQEERSGQGVVPKGEKQVKGLAPGHRSQANLPLLREKLVSQAPKPTC